MATIVTGEQYYELDGQLSEIKRQLRQPNGYPFNPEMLKRCLQDVVEGKFFFDFDSPKFIRTTPFNPAKFIGIDGWTLWKGPVGGDGLSGEEEQDERSRSLNEIELASLSFETCLNEGEAKITGEEKLRRLKEKPKLIRLGDNVFLGLWFNYQDYKKNSILEWLFRNKGITCLDFFGSILSSPIGIRHVLRLSRYEDEWHWSCVYLGCVMDRFCTSLCVAVLAK